jgi:hypothetical protein
MSTTKEVRSFQELDPKDFPEPPEDQTIVVDLNEIESSWEDDDEEKGKEVDAKAAKVKKWVETHLKKLDEFYKLPRAIQDKPRNQETTKEIRKRIRGYMEHPDPEWGPCIRAAAWVAVLVHELSTTTCDSYRKAMSWLDDLVKRELLEDTENNHAPLYAWKRFFRIPEEANFRKPEFSKVTYAMKGFVERTNRETTKRRSNRLQELRKEAQLSPCEFLVNEDNKGTALLYVPSQIMEKMDEQKRLRIDILRDGYIFAFKSANGTIFPKEAVGSFAESMARDVELTDKGIPLYWLKIPWPPGWKKLTEEMGHTPEMAGILRRWFFFFKRAKGALEHQDEARKQERIEFDKEVDMDEEKWFLESQGGVVLADFSGIYSPEDKQDKPIRDIFLLMERMIDQDGQSTIRIKKAPQHLKEFLASCMGTYTEGRKFGGVPPRLRAILQACYGQAESKRLLTVQVS